MVHVIKKIIGMFALLLFFCMLNVFVVYLHGKDNVLHVKIGQKKCILNGLRFINIILAPTYISWWKFSALGIHKHITNLMSNS